MHSFEHLLCSIVLLERHFKKFNFFSYIDRFDFLFYHGYWKDQRDATVIILRYTKLCHNGLWEVICTSPFGTVWKKSVHLKVKIISINVHVDFMFWSRIDLDFILACCIIALVFFLWWSQCFLLLIHHELLYSNNHTLSRFW